jgi:hypothetical protein
LRKFGGGFAEFEWLKTLAEANPFRQFWLIFPQLYQD